MFFHIFIFKKKTFIKTILLAVRKKKKKLRSSGEQNFVLIFNIIMYT